MRAIAEEAAELVREYKGAYSGEHGDGLVRSEWIAPMFGPRITAAFEEIKDIFDPAGLLNPGKIVRPSKMDDRTLFRFKPGYAAKKIDTALDWSEWGGFDKAVEMCNNNGHCRKFDAGTMCPSFRATGEEQHLTRGRANTLRLALSGQLHMKPGDDAFTSHEMYETLELCVSCKGCKRECPTGVDMAKMKIEFLHHYRRHHGLRLMDRLIAYLPRYAPWAARFGWLLNLRDRVPGLAALSEKMTGLTARRELPRWRQPYLRSAVEYARTGRDAPLVTVAEIDARSVALFVDTFSNYYEPENAMAAMRVLSAAGYRVHLLLPPAGERPLCCGRTFLAGGLVNEARIEAQRMLKAVEPFITKGVPIVGLEPSCLLGLRDEFLSMLPGADTAALALNAMLFEEFIAREADAGRLQLQLKALPQKKALLHGHCHQKAFDVMPAVHKALKLVPELDVQTIESSCCGMAGSFGYEAAHYDVSMKMAEASLLPKVRAAAEDTLIVADGTSCRHQIHDGAQRDALHVARVLERALA
jgi:Fe-S oxidoreductase